MILNILFIWQLFRVINSKLCKTKTRIDFSYSPVIITGNENIVKLLLKYDATVNVRNRINWTPLFYSVLSGNEKVMKLLINHEDEDFSLNDLDAQGKTIFHTCAEKGNSWQFETNITNWKYYPQFVVGSVSIGKILHAYGANISAVEMENGRTPLHIAAKSGKFLSYLM